MAKLSSTQIYGDLQVDGEIKNKATIETEGVVQLNDAIDSISTAQGATPNAVKKVNDSLSSHKTDTTSHITASERTTWNGKANASHGNHVPTTQTASNSVFLRNDNTWATVTPSSIGASPTNHTHDYLPLSGGVVSGAINFANNTWNNIGDDVSIGDTNLAGRLGIKGLNGATGITFIPYSGTVSQDITIDGSGNLTVGGNTKGAFIGSLSGNASTATKLQTPRTINGVSFDGSSNITVSASANGGNADTVDGKHFSDFVQMPSTRLAVSDLNNANYPYSYRSGVPNGTEIGLPSSSWYHIDYFRHLDNNGFGYQVAYPLNHDGDIFTRWSSGTIWQEWKAINSEGYKAVATGIGAHAEGNNTVATGYGAHAEGYFTQATGYGAHAEGYDTEACNDDSHAEGYFCVSSANQAHSEGLNSTASGQYSHAEGGETTASGLGSHAEGIYCTSTNNGCHAEGYYTQASGSYSHAEGSYSTASGTYSHAEGYSSNAKGYYAHAEGAYSVASGDYSHAGGSSSNASGMVSHAEGSYTTAETYAVHVQGRRNKVNEGGATTYSATQNAFVIGNGTSDSAKSNAFRVDFSGRTYGLSAFNSTGADYAEYFEWLDGNPYNEDRIGRFVTLKENRIKLANSEDDYIIGIISGNQSIIGNSCEDGWNDMYLRDEFGRLQYEDVEVEIEVNTINEETKEIEKLTEKVMEHHIKLNPNYDSTKEYKPRSERKEWGIVGMLGQIIVKDDGTCKVDQYCKPSENGIAVYSEDSCHYRVIERINNSLIKVIMK